MFLFLYFAALAAAQITSLPALSSSTTAFDAGVPTGMPVPGDYTGALRPQVHFSPPQMFMNDPNGCFLDANGTWHLYYQYNPTSIVAGNQHWGHATSRDLYHWENQAIAIFPDNSTDQIFSGSAVIDANNTSGLFPSGQTDGIVAIYTLNSAASQTQNIAYSTDGGYTFTKYSGNPVIASDSTQFRDPKVIWHEDHWVMVVAYAQEYTVGFFTSPDLRRWTHASNFSHAGLLGLQYECPNLVSLPMDGADEPVWLLAVSVNPGAPLGGSITQYFPGSFDGRAFAAVDGAARVADFGKDNYAGQYFFGVPRGQDAVSVAWASNWQYVQATPTAAEGWRSAMSLPRKARLANITRIGYDLVSAPYGLSVLYDGDAPLATSAGLGNGSVLVDYSGVASGALYFQANVSGIPANGAAQGTLNFTLASSVTGERVAGGFFLGGDAPFWVDRGATRGFDNPFFTDKFSTNSPVGEAGTFMLEGVVDRSILELFLDGGTRSATTTFFPTQRLDTVTLAANGLNEGVVVSVAVWALRSAWADMAADDGIVYGNVTGNSTGVMRRSGNYWH